jgi:hypothetical protein
MQVCNISALPFLSNKLSKYNAEEMFNGVVRILVNKKVFNL